MQGQDHVDWTSPQVKEVVELMNHSYPGGIAGYVAKARTLLSPAAQASAAAGESSKRNLKLPAHRVDIDLAPTASNNTNTAAEQQLALGNQIAGTRTAFVLVAGGLGERLGAQSLKVSLPVQIAGAFAADLVAREHNSNNNSSNIPHRSQHLPDEGCFLHHYIAWMLYCSSHHNASSTPPMLIIMTSDDTHTRTQELLQRNFYFGSSPSNVVMLKQTAVPALSDSSGKLATTTPEGKTFVMKPHGHGDVHRLLLSSGVLSTLQQRGVKYIVFMQDTNSGATTTLPQSLAVLEKEGWAMGFTCVPRMPGEAIGALVEADRLPSSSTASQSSRVTYCVEYNVLDDMLKREGFPEGDSASAAATGSEFSPFPGTINTLLLRLDAYAETVTRTEGVIAEFINPKYSDPVAKTSFKSPARLETLMQDIALEIDSAKHGPVGAIVFDRRTYFPVKNALLDGVTKWKTMGIDPHNASQGEAGFFLLRRLAAVAGRAFHPDCVAQQQWPLERCVAVSPKLSNDKNNNQTQQQSFTPDFTVLGELPIAVFPLILTPACVDSLSAAKQFPNRDAVKMSRRSSFVVVGNGAVTVQSLDLDGALVVEAPAGSRVVLDLAAEPIRNKGWKLVAVDPSDTTNNTSNEAQRLRGFKYESEETLIVRVPIELLETGLPVKVTMKKTSQELEYTALSRV